MSIACGWHPGPKENDRDLPPHRSFLRRPNTALSRSTSLIVHPFPFRSENKNKIHHVDRGAARNAASGRIDRWDVGSPPLLPHHTDEQPQPQQPFLYIFQGLTHPNEIEFPGIIVGGIGENEKEDSLIVPTTTEATLDGAKRKGGRRNGECQEHVNSSNGVERSTYHTIKYTYRRIRCPQRRWKIRPDRILDRHWRRTG